MAIDLPMELRNLTLPQKVIYGAGALFGLALASPLAILALTTVTTAAMAGVVGLLLFLGFSALPFILRWWRIQVFKMLKATARRNPVETLQLELVDRKRAFEAAGARVVAVSAMRDSLREKLDEYVARHRTKDPSLERSINQLSDLVDRLSASLRQTGIKLEEFERFVARQADRWKLAKATGELSVLLKKTAGGDVTDQFLKDEAVDSIRGALNLSFAEIDQILQKVEIKQSARPVMPVPATVSVAHLGIPEAARGGGW